MIRGERVFPGKIQMLKLRGTLAARSLARSAMAPYKTVNFEVHGKVELPALVWDRGRGGADTSMPLSRLRCKACTSGHTRRRRRMSLG